jgi:hypothetical protein
MKINDAVFFTDNTTVRLETDKGNYYLDNKGKLYDMHPINIMANELSGSLLTEVKKIAKAGKYKNDTEVKKWL